MKNQTGIHPADSRPGSQAKRAPGREQRRMFHFCKIVTVQILIVVMLSLFILPAYAEGDANVPSLTIDISGLTAAMGGSGGGEVEVLDLSWYTPYKQTVDGLISGFLWLGYIWHLFKIAPSILGSVGLAVDKADSIDNGVKGRRK